MTAAADPTRAWIDAIVFWGDSALEGAVGFPEIPSTVAWWRVFTRPGWRHVGLLVRELGTNRWTVVNFLYSCVDVAGVDSDDPEGRLRNAGFRVMRVTALRETRRVTPRGIMTCVSLTKAILGIRAWRVMTPEGLYRYLAARKGVVTNVVAAGSRKVRSRKKG